MSNHTRSLCLLAACVVAGPALAAYDESHDIRLGLLSALSFGVAMVLALLGLVFAAFGLFRRSLFFRSFLVLVLVIEAAKVAIGLWPAVRGELVAFQLTLFLLIEAVLLVPVLSVPVRQFRGRDVNPLAGMGRFRRGINIAGLVLLAGSLGYCGFNWATAESRVRAVCDQIRPGMSLVQLREFAAIKGLRSRVHEGINFLAELRTSGRHACKVIVEHGVVKSSEYDYAD